jgi:hypothetical protein
MRDEYSKCPQKGKITIHFLSHSGSFSVDFNAKVSLNMIKFDCFESKVSMLRYQGTFATALRIKSNSA